MAQPNIVFCFADQMRAQATGYAGDPNAETPTLDSLAGESIHFTHAVAGHPVCCPYRASLMTGQYPLTHGVYINDVPLENKVLSLAQAFAQGGYDTAYIGKWHLYGSPDGGNGRRRAYIPRRFRQGFDYWRGFECNHDYMHSPYFADDDPLPRYWHGYDAVAQTEDACRYIQDHAGGEKPFLLMLSLGTPHDPYDCAPEAYLRRYRDRDIALRPNVPAERRDAATASLRGYYAHIAALDDCVAQILTTLDESGIAEETILIFTSDHGDMHESQGLITKHVPFDESIRVPFLLRFPEQLGRQARELPLLIDAPDIMPTLLSLCGLPVPQSVEGRDFSAAIRGEAAVDGEMSAFLQVPAPYWILRTQGIPEYRGVRTRQYTYARNIHGPWLLFDNEADPYQLRNLCGDPAHASLQRGLEEELQGWLRRLGDEFLPGRAYLQRDGLMHYREANVPWGVRETPWTIAKEGE